MPLVVDDLSVWVIGFRWAGQDPDRFFLRIPSEVRDNFSTIFDAILHQHLHCLTLAPEKYQGEDREIARYHIRHWIDDINAAIAGRRFSRRLLRHSTIERGAFQDWCERRSIPLPTFWFPSGWTEYRWPLNDFAPIPERSESFKESSM